MTVIISQNVIENADAVHLIGRYRQEKKVKPSFYQFLKMCLLPILASELCN